MSEFMDKRLIEEVASNLGIKTTQIEAALSLLEEGGTIPFIARYRKEITGSLDEEEIRAISKEYEYAVSLKQRKEDIKRLIDEKGMLTDELIKEIDKAEKLITLEDIYRPFKEKKKTKATEAIKAGLKPLADLIMTFPDSINIEKEAAKYLNDTVLTYEDALTGAKYIIAEDISDNKEYRTYIREDFLEKGIITSKKKKNAEDPRETYRDYYEYSEQIKRQKSYRILALNRAEKEGVVNVSIEKADSHIEYLNRKIIKKNNSPVNYLIKEAIEDSYNRLIFPSVEREVRSILTSEAEDGAIKLFGDNLEHLLLSAPLKGKRILGVDPAYRTGCKIAALDETGKVLDKGVMYQNQKYPDEKVPESRIKEAKDLFVNFIKKDKIDIVAIGNGTASRETEKFVADTIKEAKLLTSFIIVSEAGASVYSASPTAIEEFPDYHVEERSAVSIGRRIQDPLAELVKIEPQAIGVGQYQHDVSQAKLSDTLDFVVEKAVNSIGVDINTASKSLLEHISGLNKAIAKNIVTYRDLNGAFKDRKEIKKVPKLGDKAFEQSVGFLRIIDSDNPLDKTAIHPESYKTALKVLSYLGFSSEDLGSVELINKIKSYSEDKMAKDLDINPITLEDILDAFIAPLRDPRDSLKKPILKSEVLHLEDLKPGMELEGTVRNITDFGAFIDVGIKESGLVHISRMSSKRINHPSEVVKVGDIITVYVVNTDIERKRLALSMVKDRI